MKAIFTAGVMLALMASLAMGTTCTVKYDSTLVCDSARQITSYLVYDSVWVPGDTNRICSTTVRPGHNDTTIVTVWDTSYTCNAYWDSVASKMDTVCGSDLTYHNTVTVTPAPAETVTTCGYSGTGHYVLRSRTVYDTTYGSCRVVLNADTTCTYDNSYPVYSYYDTSRHNYTAAPIRDTATGTIITLSTRTGADTETIRVAPVSVDSAYVPGCRGLRAVEVTLSPTLAANLDTSELCFSYAGMGISASGADSLGIYYKNGSQWQYIGGRADKYAQVIRVRVTHFSTYGLFAPMSGSAVYANTAKLLPVSLSVNPNPVNQATSVMFTLNAGSSVQIGIYSLNGVKVRSLAAANYNAGGYSVTWNGKDDAGKSLSSGIYLVRMQAGNKVLMQKASLIR